MAQELMGSIVEHFASVADPRCVGKREHLLLEIFVIAISAVVCGANDWVAVETFGKAKESWLRKFLALPQGIPSHDTFWARLCLAQARASASEFCKLGASGGAGDGGASSGD